MMRDNAQAGSGPHHVTPPPGGCEGFAMLNRTNLTLSALSNRLNLGTRSLVLNTSVNHGAHAQHIRHSHHDVMRDRMVWYAVFSFKPGKYDIPPIQGSIIPGQQQRPIRCQRPEASLAACLARDVFSPVLDWSVTTDGSVSGSLVSSSVWSLDSSSAKSTPKRRPGRCTGSAGRRGGSRRAARHAAATAGAATAAIAEF
jgi:hypothetical protein